MKAHFGLLTVPLLLTGCATGFDRNAIESRMQIEPTLSSAIIDPDSVKSVTSVSVKPAELTFPCKIAVCLKGDGNDWRWEEKDRKVMHEWAKTLKEEGIASDVFILPNMLSGRGDLFELRTAATNCGANALFVIQGGTQVDRYLNPASVFNLTVVGGFIVPGSHRDALFLMEGCLFDPVTGFVYAGVQGEGVGKIIRPTFIIEDKDAITRAKTIAIESFGQELLDRMRHLAEGNPAGLRRVAVDRPMN